MTGDFCLSACAGGGRKLTARPEQNSSNPFSFKSYQDRIAAMWYQFRRLQAFQFLFYADPSSQSLDYTESMQRLTFKFWTARFLLLFALLGTIAPVALQAAVAPLHACCRRAGSHRCADPATSSSEPIFRDASCCNRNASHAVTTSHWALAELAQVAISEQNVAVRDFDLRDGIPAKNLLSSLPARAPPAC
jgi:hypothetical protein